MVGLQYIRFNIQARSQAPSPEVTQGTEAPKNRFYMKKL